MPNYNLYTLAALNTALGTATDQEAVIIQEHIDYRGELDAYAQDLVTRAAQGIGSNPPGNPPPPPGV